MTNFFPLKQKPQLSPFKKGDVLVLFGELFTRGYANGLVEEAEKVGMTIIRATVGRREKDGSLRPLHADECANIPHPFINIPLEAGFDMEPDSKGQTPCDQLKDVKLTDWVQAKLDWQSIDESRQNGEIRFKKNTQLFLNELEKHIPAGANVLFAHLMAGGVPRAKILMPILNRAFKGQGDRHISTSTLINSEIGQLCIKSFQQVTADTFKYLIEASAPLRNKIESQGCHVSYTAYGYHGTEVLIDDTYKWQTYTCYFQGWAKTALEKYSETYAKQGVQCCVYNCPEILTNSSSVFQGVEVSLYTLMGAIQKDCKNAQESQKVLNQCQALLKDGISTQDVVQFLQNYLKSDLIKNFNSYDQWPQHSTQDQMDFMLQNSDKLFDMHKDQKQLITSVLSEVVIKSCGYVMLHDCWKPLSPVAWIGHDLVVKCM